MAETEANGAPLPEDMDNFRKIKKITLPVARALYELEIRRFSDMAALTPGILADLLRAKNIPFVSTQRIEREDWIGQARKLASEQPAPEEESASQEAATPLKKEPAGPARHNWRELADFFVSFGEETTADGKTILRTKAHFSQGDLPFERDGVATSELIDWMLRQANLTVVEENPQAPALDESVGRLPGVETHSEEQLPLVVSNLWVSQVNHPTSSGLLAEERMVRVEAEVDVSPEAAVFLIDPTPIMVSIYLVNTQTNGATFIETPNVTVSQDMLPYNFRYDFPVPPPGRYQLYLLAGLPTAGKAPVLQQGPIVRVEG